MRSLNWRVLAAQVEAALTHGRLDVADWLLQRGLNLRELQPDFCCNPLEVWHWLQSRSFARG